MNPSLLMRPNLRLVLIGIFQKCPEEFVFIGIHPARIEGNSLITDLQLCVESAMVYNKKQKGLDEEFKPCKGISNPQRTKEPGHQYGNEVLPGNLIGNRPYTIILILT